LRCLCLDEAFAYELLFTHERIKREEGEWEQLSPEKKQRLLWVGAKMLAAMLFQRGWEVMKSGGGNVSTATATGRKNH